MSDEPENEIPAEFAEDQAPQPSAPQPPAGSVNLPHKADKPKVQMGDDGQLLINDIDSFYRLAQGIARAGFAPKNYRETDGNGKPNGPFSIDKIAIGMMFAKACGFHPLTGLRSVAVINGTPSVWGDGILAICQATRELEQFTETEILAEKDGDGVKAGQCIGYICTAKRKGQEPYTAKFTREDAKQAKLLSKDGPWTLYPRRMYQMRARAWCLRAVFADRLQGIPVAEEMQDVIEGEATEVQPQRQIESKPSVSVAAALDKFTGRSAVMAESVRSDDGNNPETKG